MSDSGEFEATDSAMYRIDADGTVETVVSAEYSPEIASPNGLAFDAEGRLLTVDLHTGKLLKIGEDGFTVLA